MSSGTLYHPITVEDQTDEVYINEQPAALYGLGSVAWPIGSVYLSVVDTNPATLLGFGTWEALAPGRMLVGFDASDAKFDALEETGGANTVTLTTTELPSHNHGVTDPGHTHVQDAHTHVQDSHAHTLPVGPTDDTSTPFSRADAGTNASGEDATASVGSTTATNQSATAVNQSATTGITIQNAGSGAAFSVLNNYLVVRMWKRVS